MRLQVLGGGIAFLLIGVAFGVVTFMDMQDAQATMDEADAVIGDCNTAAGLARQRLGLDDGECAAAEEQFATAKERYNSAAAVSAVAGGGFIGLGLLLMLIGVVLEPQKPKVAPTVQVQPVYVLAQPPPPQVQQVQAPPPVQQVQTPAPPPAAVASTPAQKFCPQCGAARGDTPFCGSCGAR